MPDTPDERDALRRLAAAVQRLADGADVTTAPLTGRQGPADPRTPDGGAEDVSGARGLPGGVTIATVPSGPRWTWGCDRCHTGALRSWRYRDNAEHDARQHECDGGDQ